jgi:YesN/AraC family two-component response regulator
MESLTILIVDDDAAIGRLLSRVLAAEGHEVLTAASGEEALEILGQERIDLAFVDLRLTGADGITTIKKMKESAPDLNFVVISGFGDMPSVKEAVHIGVFDYITKPFDLDYIRHLVRHIGQNRLKILPYAEYMEQVFKGELTVKEIAQKKFNSFKEEIDDRIQNLSDIKRHLDKGIYKYYKSSSPRVLLAKNIKHLFTNFYFVVITCGILLGILSGYIYMQVSGKKAYQAAAGERRINISDFYKALSELKYWMQKHTEQGIVLERDENLGR